jgi:hypothetical protein
LLSSVLPCGVQSVYGVLMGALGKLLLGTRQTNAGTEKIPIHQIRTDLA